MGTQLAAVSGSYRTKQVLNGTVKYAASSPTISFSANYNSNFELGADISTIAGNYSGSSAIGMGAEISTFAIDGNGTISGIGASGCTLSGTIQKGGSGRPYSVAVTFGGLPCRFPGATASGIAYFDPASNTFYAVAPIPSQNTEMVAIGTRQ
jgi:hypothetical protein